MPFSHDQGLNELARMLDEIYGPTQNYTKDHFEIQAHLSEVCGAFGKYLFKRRSPSEALPFLPKILAWSLALAQHVLRKEANVEALLLRKFPTVCPYCGNAPCECSSLGKEARLDAKGLQDFYDRRGPGQGRRLNDFQHMFQSIYETTWGIGANEADNYAALQKIFIHLVEELSELGEAVRFVHLHKPNFGNELADFIAWWFALVSSIHSVMPTGTERLLAADVVWASYPGFCRYCEVSPCDCRPGPVRELLSKPSLLDLSKLDGLTQASNRLCFNQDVKAIENGERPFAMPASCIFVDLDEFKSWNEQHSHDFGDRALTHLATVLREKLRGRDRLYRYGGDEFVILASDLSAAEAQGMIRRCRDALRTRPVIDANNGFKRVISLSVGIVEFGSREKISEAVHLADAAAMASKDAGRDRITIHELPQ